MIDMTKIDQAKTALVVIDFQNDFLPAASGRGDGALAVPGGNEIAGPIESLIRTFDNVILTQDWHPATHKSFAASHDGKAPFETVEMPYGTQNLWPDHCVQGSLGAEIALAPALVDRAQLIIRKGMNADIDSYSAFVENDKTTHTGLAGYLRDRGITHVVLCGLATDFCVAFSALDARGMGFEVTLITKACRGISPDGTAAQMDAMRAAGVVIA